MWVLALDVGTSSARAVGYDAAARPIAGLDASVPYEPVLTADGGVELDADHLLEAVTGAIDRCVAGATEPLLNVVTTGRPASFARAALSTRPTYDGTGTPDAESTHVFMLVIVVRATESLLIESVVATACAVGVTARFGAT